MDSAAEQLSYSKDAKNANSATHPLGALGALSGILEKITAEDNLAHFDRDNAEANVTA